jgi:hypothetical protein
MVRFRHIRRALLAASTATALLLSGTAGTASATATVPRRVCDFDWQQGPWHIKQLIRCAALRWDSPGSPGRAVEVARCESGLRPRAYNPNGYAGLYQQATRHWPDRAEQWGQQGRSVFNGRANIIVSVRMAAAAGSWNDWGGCA